MQAVPRQPGGQMHWAAPTSQYPAPQEAGHGIRGGGRDAAAVGDDNAERGSPGAAWIWAACVASSFPF